MRGLVREGTSSGTDGANAEPVRKELPSRTKLDPARNPRLGDGMLTNISTDCLHQFLKLVKMAELV